MKFEVCLHQNVIWVSAAMSVLVPDVRCVPQWVRLVSDSYLLPALLHREVTQIDQFLQDTAAREANAKLRLQRFIEELLDRADRAEKQLQIVSSCGTTPNGSLSHCSLSGRKGSRRQVGRAGRGLGFGQGVTVGAEGYVSVCCPSQGCLTPNELGHRWLGEAEPGYVSAVNSLQCLQFCFCRLLSSLLTRYQMWLSTILPGLFIRWHVKAATLK